MNDTTPENLGNANREPLPTKTAVIVRVRWAFMEGRKTDRKASEEYATHSNADSDSLSVSKRLIQPIMLRPLRQIRSATNKYIRANTHPWDDNGGRLLASKKVSAYLTFMNKQKELFETEKRELRGKYDLIIDDAKHRLNGLFKVEEFPPIDEWIEKYGVRLEMETISDADTRLNNVDSEVLAEIRDSVAQNVQQKLKDANRENYLRIIEAVEKLIGRLQALETGEAERFRSSTYDSVIEILKTADDMNFADDKVLSKLIKQTKEIFADKCSSLEELKVGVGEPNTKRQDATASLKTAVNSIMANLPR
jgi:hypothetical protein